MRILSNCNLTAEELILPEGAEPLSLLWIGPGSFNFGRPKVDDYDEGGENFVAVLSRGFWLSRFLVTQSQWCAVMPGNPSTFSRVPNENLPVETVSWFEATRFCDTLNDRLKADLISHRFRLPSEIEWEYACRAGTSTKYYNGDDPAGLNDIAWFKENSGGRTHSVGQKQPNAWGFFDLIGNVDEWCCDSQSSYPTTRAVDWVGDDKSRERVVRGGSWATPQVDPALCVTEKGYVTADVKKPFFGFRVGLFSVS